MKIVVNIYRILKERSFFLNMTPKAKPTKAGYEYLKYI